jgi:hypothetical protein
MKSGQQSAEGPRPPETGTEATGGPKPHERVPLLVSRARDNGEACRELIDALIAMRAPGDEADEARVVVAELDAKALDGLRDEAGRDAKAEAVETLLSLGFPHALSVSPEDLDYFRDAKPQTLAGLVLKVQRSRKRMLQLGLLGQVLAAGAVLATGHHDEAQFPLALLLALTTTGGAVWLNARPPKAGKQALPLTLVLLALLATTSVAAVAGAAGLGVSAILGLGVYGLLGPPPSR